MKKSLNKNISMVSLLLICVFLCSLAGYASGAAGYDKKIDEIFAPFNKAGSPGCAVSVYKDGKIIFEKGYGTANIEYGKFITPETLFHIASVSKQFTAFAVLLLENEGKLSLDDDIRKYLPYMPDFGHKITIRHLLNHTSGLRDQWDLVSTAGWSMEDVITQEQILRIASMQKALNFNPGDEFMYSNTGFTLLADIVEKVSGQSFCDYTKKHIFTPLGMNSSFFHIDQDQIIAGRSYSYIKDEKGNFKNCVLSYANVGATSLFTNTRDMAKWINNFFTFKVGGKQVMEKMLTVGVLNNGKKTNYACGLVVDTYKGLKRINHSGGDAGYRTYIAIFPEEKLGIVVLSNLGNISPDGLAMKVAQVYLSGKFKKEEKNENIAPIKIEESALKQYEGKYETESLGVVCIETNKDQLMFDSSFTGPIALKPLSQDKFYLEMANAAVSFKKDAEGKVIKFIINEGKETSSEAPKVYNLTLSEKELKEYEGKYYSDELEAVYTIKIKDGKLTAAHIHNGNFVFSPGAKDVFYGNLEGLGKITFQRNSSGQLNGFKLTQSRAKNLLFKKVDL